MIYEHHGEVGGQHEIGHVDGVYHTRPGLKTILNHGTFILNPKKPEAREPQSSKDRASGLKLGLKAREPSPARKNSSSMVAGCFLKCEDF